MRKPWKVIVLLGYEGWVTGPDALPESDLPRLHEICKQLCEPELNDGSDSHLCDGPSCDHPHHDDARQAALNDGEADA
jgi:hypothetical protein